MISFSSDIYRRCVGSSWVASCNDALIVVAVIQFYGLSLQVYEEVYSLTALH